MAASITFEKMECMKDKALNLNNSALSKPFKELFKNWMNLTDWMFLRNGTPFFVDVIGLSDHDWETSEIWFLEKK